MMFSAYMKVLKVSPLTGTDHPVSTTGAELVRSQRMKRAAGPVMISVDCPEKPSQPEPIRTSRYFCQDRIVPTHGQRIGGRKGQDGHLTFARLPTATLPAQTQ